MSRPPASPVRMTTPEQVTSARAIASSIGRRRVKALTTLDAITRLGASAVVARHIPPLSALVLFVRHVSQSVVSLDNKPSDAVGRPPRCLRSADARRGDLLALWRDHGVASRHVAVRHMPAEARLLRGRPADPVRCAGRGAPGGVRRQARARGLPLGSKTMAVIEAVDLRRTYKTTTGVLRRKPARGRGGSRDLVRRRAGRALRPARPERRRQDDDDQDADHAAPAVERRGAGARARRRHGGPGRAAADRLRLRRRPRPLRAPVRLRQPPLLRRALRRLGQGAAAADRRGARARRPEGPRAGTRRGLLARHAPAAAHRARDPPRPRGRLPRRADDRRRPGRRTRAAPDDLRPDRVRQDGAADDALHVRGRRALRPDRRDREGRDRRRGNARAS